MPRPAIHVGGRVYRVRAKVPGERKAETQRHAAVRRLISIAPGASLDPDQIARLLDDNDLTEICHDGEK
jgi:hypothetical protein